MTLYENQSKDLKKYGFTIFRDVITEELCNTLKKDIDDWFDNVADENQLVEDKRFKKFVVPDAVSNPHFYNFSKVFEANHLLEFLKYHCGGDVMYLDHFDAHRNLSSGWHEDTNQKHFKTDNHHQGISLFDPNYHVYRVCFYLQDHNEDFCGLSVKPGTHMYPKSVHNQFNNEVKIGTRKCDMIIFDCRLSHKGIVYKDSAMGTGSKNRHSIFLCLGASKNIFSETHRMGAVERQNKQLKRDTYKINQELKSKLIKKGYKIFEDDSVFY